LTVATALMAASALAGCVGQTEFATGVSDTAATFHARGEAGPSGTDVYFEYWPASDPTARQETPHRSVGPKVAGPFDEPVDDLDSSTAYAYRVCGEEGAGAPLCAQVRTLRTSGDSVQAWGAASTPDDAFRWDRIDLNAFSSAFGGSPSGRVFDRVTVRGNPLPFSQGSLTDDNVTCVNVDGKVAVVGFTDQDGTQNFVGLEDNGPAGSNQDSYFALPNDFYNRTPTDCSIPLTAVLGPVTMRYGDVAISDGAAATLR
jgi:hypothetical protein